MSADFRQARSTLTKGLKGFGYKQLILIGAALMLSVALALAATIFCFGRADPLHANKEWIGAIALSLFAIAGWQCYFIIRVFHTPERGRDNAITTSTILTLFLSAGLLALDFALYRSDSFHHTYTGDWLFRRTIAVVALAVLYATFLLQETILDWGSNDHPIVTSLKLNLQRQGEAAALLATFAIGIIQGTSYITVVGDDYSRYWTIADSLAQGYGYPASEVGQGYQAGGMSAYLVDLPGLPLAMLLFFKLMGHSALAAMAPAIIGASLFCVFAFLALKALTNNTALSYVCSSLLATFPLFSFYVLRAAEPDGIFVTLLMAIAFLAIRCENYPGSIKAWIALGFIAGAAALTRPEGIMYAGVLFAVLFFGFRTHRYFWMSAAVTITILAAFSACTLVNFGTPWPSSFAGTIQIASIAQNLGGFAGSALPNYAAALGLPIPLLLLLLVIVLAFYAIGSWQIARSRPYLLFLPLLPAMNLVLFLLVSPALTRPEIPHDYFRRAAYGIPYLMMVASYPLAKAWQNLPKDSLRWVLASVIVATSIVAQTYIYKLSSSPELIFEGGTQILTSGTYILATDLIAHPYSLPWLPYERRDGVLQVDRSFDYMRFRTDLNSYFAPMDLHGSDRAEDYVKASLAVFIVGLFYAIMARRVGDEQIVRKGGIV